MYVYWISFDSRRKVHGGYNIFYKLIPERNFIFRRMRISPSSSSAGMEKVHIEWLFSQYLFVSLALPNQMITSSSCPLGINLHLSFHVFCGKWSFGEGSELWNTTISHWPASLNIGWSGRGLTWLASDAENFEYPIFYDWTDLQTWVRPGTAMMPWWAFCFVFITQWILSAVCSLPRWGGGRFGRLEKFIWELVQAGTRECLSKQWQVATARIASSFHFLQ